MTKKLRPNGRPYREFTKNGKPVRLSKKERDIIESLYDVIDTFGGCAGLTETEVSDLAWIEKRLIQLIRKKQRYENG